jgi:hypothetical protein
MMVAEEKRMTHKNHTPAKPSPVKRSAAKPVQVEGIRPADVRRSTYTPGRPAGVHARELGLKKR